MFQLGESDKHFLMSMLAATGVILFWKGLWEGVGSIPPLADPWVSLFVGAVILTFSGLIFSEFDPTGGIEKSAMKMMHHVHNHPQKHEFKVRYYDNVTKKEHEVEAKDIHHIEKNMIAVSENGREKFIPIHRVRTVHRAGKVVWKM